jgi:glycosyltransferase involved in cell wall biosynthesis
MNVLLVLATSGGGVGRHVAQIAAGLARDWGAAGAAGSAGSTGHRVRVAGPAQTEQDFGFTAVGAGFEPLQIAARPRPLADRRTVQRLRGLAAEADVVHAHGLRAGALAALAVRRIRRGRRPKLVVTLHNALVSGGMIAVVHAVLERIVARGADVVLVVSADLGTAMRRRGARDVRTAVVPAPLLAAPQRSAAAVRRELEVPIGAALLVTIARLAPQKGLDVLVDAVGRLSVAGVQVLAVVAGDGPLAARLSQDAADRAIPVRLLGGRTDVADLLAAADLVVVPSRWEGQPLIVQEALLAGAAIVATDAGGTAEVAGDGAVLVPPGDPAALATAIADLLADSVGLATLRQRARRRGQGLPSAEDALQAVIAVYQSGDRPRAGS